MIIESLFSLEAKRRVVNVDSWSDFLGIEALECCQYGKRIPKSNSTQLSAASYWTMGITRAEEESLGSQLTKLLDALHPKAGLIRSLIDKYQLDCGVASFIWLSDEYRIADLDLYLEQSLVRKLGEIHADYCIKIYEQ